MHTHLALLLVALTACSGKFASDSASADDDDDDDGTTDDGIDVPDGITDPTVDLDTTGCEDFEGTAIPGAASYWWGVYEAGDGTAWSGTEQWMLFANDAWRDRGGKDCTITWYVSAAESDTGACAACDLGLSVSATYDATRTDCPEEIYEGSESFQESYAILRSTGGLAAWYFAGSGEQFATGEHVTGAVSYVTDKACKWF